jgi:hypothetical protein
MDVSWVYKTEMRHWVTKPVWNFGTCLTFFRWRSWQWRLGVFIYNQKKLIHGCHTICGYVIRYIIALACFDSI